MDRILNSQSATSFSNRDDESVVRRGVINIRKKRMPLTHNPRTPTKIALLELLNHLRQASRRHDIPSMNQSIQMSSGLLDRLAHVVFTIQIEDIGDQVEGVLIVVDFGVQAGQVEAVRDVFFVDFTEVLVAAGGNELSVLSA
jgi:hypothetical protein